MTFEGDPKVVPVKGIVRAGADSIVTDGAMNEVVGLEYKDGSYVPYEGAKNYGAVFPTSDVEAVYVHKTSSENNVIIKTSEGLFFIPESLFLNREGDDWGNWDRIYSGKVKDVEFVGNVICVSTEDSYNTYVYKDDIYEFYNIKSKDNNISLRMVDGIGGESDDSYGVYFSDDEKLDTNVRFTKAIGLAHSYGGLTGRVLAAVAYRLNTGEIINLSNVVLLSPSKSADRFTLSNGDSLLMNSDISYSLYPTSSLSVKEGIAKRSRSGSEATAVSSSITHDDVVSSPLLYSFDVSGTAALTEYKHFGAVCSCSKLQIKIANNAFINSKDIVSVCVFISDDIGNFNDLERFYSVGPYKDGTMSISSSYPISTVSVEGEVRDVRVFHLVGEYMLEDAKRDEWVDVDLRGKLGDVLQTLPSMNTADITMYDYYNANLNSYNGRIHQYDFLQQIRYPYGALSYDKLEGTSGVGDDEQFTSASIEVDIYMRNPLREEYKIVLFSEGASDKISLGPYVSFPSLDAYKIIIRKKIVTDNYYAKNYICEFDLKQDKELGISYCYGSGRMRLEDNTYDLPVEKSIVMPTSNTSKLVVSDTYVPTYFPKQNTYTIGNGSIIGMASLSISLSQDTFGQYPLLVFCTDGIYSMEVDTTGTGVYNNVAPFSREVCVNRNSICEIDGAVLFASSKGLMVATAQGVEEFVPTLNGKPKHGPTDNQNEKGIGLSAYKSIISHAQSTYLVDCVDTQDFKEYVSHGDTHITYASEKNKIVVYNKHKNYIYWIDIQTRNTTKLPIGISIDDNNYPSESYVTTDGEIILLNENSNKGEVDTLFQTRPIKLDGGFHSAMRVIVRGYFKGEDDKFAVLLVLGSYDGVNWQPIGATERMLGEGFEDIGCVTDRVSHKYAMVIFTARLSRDSHIDGIELTNHNKYNNKLK